MAVFTGSGAIRVQMHFLGADRFLEALGVGLVVGKRLRAIGGGLVLGRRLKRWPIA